MGNAMKRLAPIHPGEILLNEYLLPLELSQNRLAIAIGVSPHRINGIVLGKRKITADTALRLSIFLKTSPNVWLGLQQEYDLNCVRLSEESKLRRSIRPLSELVPVSANQE